MLLCCTNSLLPKRIMAAMLLLLCTYKCCYLACMDVVTLDYCASCYLARTAVESPDDLARIGVDVVIVHV